MEVNTTKAVEQPNSEGNSDLAAEQNMAAIVSNNASPRFAGIDITQKVNLLYYLVVERPPNEACVLDELNKLLINDINTTIEFKYWS